MKKYSSFIPLAILTVLLGVMFYLYFTKNAEPFRGPGASGPGADGPDRMARMVSELNLTEEQQKKIKELRDQDKEVMEQKQAAAQETRKKLAEAMKNPSTTDEELRNLFNQADAARDALQTARFDDALAVRSLLTPEQIKKFKGPGGPQDGLRRQDKRREKFSE